MFEALFKIRQWSRVIAALHWRWRGGGFSRIAVDRATAARPLIGLLGF
ncbi:MAG: hypothetical protein QOF70_2854 [Acetobacteraceae bacterium]|jgi:hypothetical protein|nr:hypothetical protein [Rhodopila sp.]MEA2728379.1 hypothetical protein [Acetobacteraceae bacterium]